MREAIERVIAELEKLRRKNERIGRESTELDAITLAVDNDERLTESIDQLKEALSHEREHTPEHHLPTEEAE